MVAFVIKSVIVLSVMYVPYMLMLRKESFFRFNRMVLICIMMCAFVLPLCNVHKLSRGNNVLNKGMEGVIEIGMPIISGITDARQGLSEADALSEKSAVAQTYQVFNVLFAFYILGAVITLLWKTFQFANLYREIRRGVLWKDTIEGATVYCHADDVAPFSWMRCIVISEKDYTNNALEILRHELGHIHNHHSLDIILLNALQVIQWMNPLVYILGASLRDVHEYEADEAVLTSGVNIRQYQTLLIRKAVGSSSYTFANSFNHSLLKKRITMMLQKKSNPWMRTKALYIIPVAAIALSAFATPKLSEKVDASLGTTVVNRNKDTKSFAKTSAKSEENVVLPVDSDIVIQKVRNSDNKVIVYLIDGKKSSAEMLEKLPPNDIKSINVIKKPEALAAMGYKDVDSVIEVFTVNKKDGKVLDTCEKMPEFEGGYQELMKFLMRNLRYPAIALDLGVECRKIIRFTIMSDGSVANVEPVIVNNMTEEEFITIIAYEQNHTIEELKEKYGTEKLIEAANEALDKEAVRVINATNGKWVPGEDKGCKVNVKFNIPIAFRLK